MARRRTDPATNAEAQRLRILDAAEVVLRRHGAGRTNVVDVARELGQSHASVYRYFASKATLIDALAERWLRRVLDPLEPIVRAEGSAGDRLVAWLRALHRFKVGKVHDDPELFQAYQGVAAESPAVVASHLNHLVEHVAAIITSGVEAGEFPRETDPQRAARAVLNGSLAYHHPRLLAERPRPGADLEAEAEDVFRLLVLGLRSGAFAG